MTEEMHHQKLKAQLGAMEERLKKIRFWRAAALSRISFNFILFPFHTAFPFGIKSCLRP